MNTATEPVSEAQATGGARHTVKAIMAYLQERRLQPGDALRQRCELHGATFVDYTPAEGWRLRFDVPGFS